MHARSTEPLNSKTRAERADARERVGNGSQLTPDDFRRLTMTERVVLREADPDTYRALADGRQPGAWRPSDRDAGGNR